VRYRLYGGALGRGYGYPTPEAREGAEQVETLTGATGEVTYSGKALAGLRALVAEPRYRDKTFLLWNTLSTPRPQLHEPGKVATELPRSLAWMLDEAPVA
jgi:D-cysteine desulfhydrase